MNVFIVGIGGKMGRVLCERAAEKGVTISGGLDKTASPLYPTFASAKEVTVPVDAIIDFSRPSTLTEIIALCDRFSCPCVLCTTGYNAAEQKKIQELSARVPVFQSENMSLGVNVLSLLAEKAAALLQDFDIEIIERHHNQKADAPSGTAKLLCRAIERGTNYTPDYIYGREGDCKRKKGEIGVHAVRGGTIVGEHEIAFCGQQEVVTLSHSAGSRSIFADGALEAAKWIMGKSPALYDMRNMLKI
ncbi:MAG: 4-hydroxy-tetrahydrodipicolinate reductase [Clostridia bacterium]|nr:4-hydroxy-tetrahydrodipicolinate reductase [Clostridia bacterium]